MQTLSPGFVGEGKWLDLFLLTYPSKKAQQHNTKPLGRVPSDQTKELRRFNKATKPKTLYFIFLQLS